MLNRLHNAKNPFQGDFKKVLAVCSAGLLRSPTVAWVLGQDPYNYNCRAAGVHDYALIPVDKVLLTWADEIVCLEQSHKNIVVDRLDEFKLIRVIKVLAIPDDFPYRDRELVRRIKEFYPITKGTTN